MADSKVVAYRSYSPIDIELAEAQLRAVDIPYVRIGRGNAALVGVGDSIVEQLIEVDERDLAAARALLAVIQETPKEVPEPSDLPKGSEKSHLRALGVSLLWPGLGLAYAGLPIAGFSIALWAFVALMMRSQTGEPVSLGLFGQLLPRLVDITGAQLCLARFGRRPHSGVKQIVVGLVLVGGFYLAHRLLGSTISRLL